MRKRSLHVAAGSVAILALSATLAVAVTTPVSFSDSSGYTKDVLPVQLDMGQPLVRDLGPQGQDEDPSQWVPQVDVRVEGFVPQGYDYGDATQSNQLMKDLGINEAVPAQQPSIVGQNAEGATAQPHPSTTVTVVIGDGTQDLGTEPTPEAVPETYGVGSEETHSSVTSNDPEVGQSESPDGLYRIGAKDDESAADDANSGEDQADKGASFEIPEGADYRRGEALITIASDATPQEVEDLLKSTDGVVNQTVTQDDIDAGYVKVGLEPGTSVEDAVNEVLNSDSTAVSGAQPNYVYHLMNEEGVDGLIEDIKTSESAEQPRITGFYEWQKAQLAQAHEGAEAEKGTEDGDQSGTTVMSVQSENASADTVQAEGNAQVVNTQSEVGVEAQPSVEQVSYTGQEQPSVEQVSNTGQEQPSVEQVQTTDVAEQTTQEATETQNGQQATAGEQTKPETLTPEDLIDAIAQAEIARHEANDPGFANKGQWGLESIRAPEAWAITGETKDKNVYVAVLDNGFNTSHEDLQGNLVTELAYNSYTKTKDISKDTINSDHGTHVAGIIAAVTDNSVGGSGVTYNAKVIPIKVFNNGAASSESLMNAYKYLEDLRRQGKNIRVANVSLGTFVETFNNDDKALAVIKEAFDDGLVTVASAGNRIESDPNTNPPYREYPGDYAYIVSVINLENKGSGTNDASGQYDVFRYDNSNYNVPNQGGPNTNEGKNISAPGTSIYGTLANGDYGYMTGTSMASPHVAGVLALAFSLNPSLSAQDAINTLFKTAHDLGAPSWDREYGWGEVDAYAVAESVRGEIQDVVNDVVITANVVAGSFDPEYDGREKRPQVTVTYQESKDGPSKTLDPSQYSITSYENNVNAGVGIANVVGQVSVTGATAPVHFSTSVNFTITQRPMSKTNVTGDTVLTFGRNAEVLDGTLVHIPSIRVEDTDLGYTLSGPSAYKLLDAETVTAEGTDYDIKATGCNKAGTASLDVIAPVSTIGNYTGSKTHAYRIDPLPVKDRIVTVTLDKDSYEYTGNQVRPKVTVTVSVNGQEFTMKEGTDYSLGYGDNKDETGTVTVTGMGNLTGKKEVSFKINRSINKIDVEWSGDDFAYDGSGQSSAVSIKDVDGTGLDEGEDYTLTYYRLNSSGTYESIGSTQPTDAGTYKAVAMATPNSGFAGSVEHTFKILAAPVTSATLTKTETTYNGLDQSPTNASVEVFAGTTELSPSDYTIAYKRDGVTTTDVESAGTVEVSVTGRGNYQGMVLAGTFVINKLSIRDSSVTIKPTPSSYTYDGTAKTPSVSVRINGVLIGSENYSIVGYENNTNVGTGRIKLQGQKNLTDERNDVTFDIVANSTPTNPTNPNNAPSQNQPAPSPTTPSNAPMGNPMNYLFMRRIMQSQYGYGFINPADYYRRQMMLQIMLNRMMPYGMTGFYPSQMVRSPYPYGLYDEPVRRNPVYEYNPVDYSYYANNPYAYRSYGYRAPYMNVYPVSVRRNADNDAFIRTVSPFRVDSTLSDVTYEKVNHGDGINVDARTGAVTVSPYVDRGTYDISVRVTGRDRMTGEPFSDVLHSNVYVR